MISIKQITAAWNNFFFKPESPTPIALYRILLGLLVLANYAWLLPDFNDWFSEKGTLPSATALQLSGGGGLNILKYMPAAPWAPWLVFWVSCAAALSMTLGFFTRSSAIVLFITMVTLHHRNTLILNSGDSFLRLGTFYVIFSHAGAAYSLDRLIRVARGKERGAPAPRAPWASRLIAVQLAFLYLYAFAWKATGPMWLNGTALYYTSRLAEFWRFPTPYLFEHMWTIKLMTWGTLVLEFALGVLVWVKEFRYWVLLGGVLLHAGIDWTMNIPLFGPIMVAAYINFVEPEKIDRFFAWCRGKINRAAGFKSPVPVFYDGKCAFCQRAMEVVRRLDVWHRLQFLDFHKAEVKAANKDLPVERTEKEMLVRAGNEWLGGFGAFRHIARHLPLLWIFLPLLYLPPVSFAGKRVYSRVAERRYCVLSQ